MGNSKSRFEADFLWGAATAAYQIEGAFKADGKGPSVWDDFCAQPGFVSTPELSAPASGEVACDHYHRYPEDVALMKELGLRAYRFSFSWTRLLPEGTGRVNQGGVDFYHRLIDELLASGVQPWATLFHWDYPSALYHRGGWLNPDSVNWFADYAALLAKEYGSKITHWITQNEPQCFVWLGHGGGYHAPKLTLPFKDVIRVAHHSLLAHGAAVRAIRHSTPGDCEVGYAPVGVVKMPASEKPEDIAAARKEMFCTKSLWSQAWWMDPVFFGRYPEDGLKEYGHHLQPGWEDEISAACEPLDFLGINIYCGGVIEADEKGAPRPVLHPMGSPITAFKLPVTPASLRWGPRFLHERYGVPIVITENGLSNADWIHLDGTVPDVQRIDFMRRYLIELSRAIEDGADVAGYFYWSLLDNFEWSEGYKERFGLIHVDYQTLKRTRKASFAFYQEVIRTAGANL